MQTKSNTPTEPLTLWNIREVVIEEQREAPPPPSKSKRGRKPKYVGNERERARQRQQACRGRKRLRGAILSVWIQLWLLRHAVRMVRPRLREPVPPPGECPLTPKQLAQLAGSRYLPVDSNVWARLRRDYPEWAQYIHDLNAYLVQEGCGVNAGIFMRDAAQGKGLLRCGGGAATWHWGTFKHGNQEPDGPFEEELRSLERFRNGRRSGRKRAD